MENAALELRMTTDLATALPQEIGFNFEELEVELRQRLEHYNHLVVTEDSIKEAKDDRADLRKLKDAIEARRKDVKKQCEAPYKAFETKVKRLTALIDAPIAAIDGQVKTFEEQERQKKYGEVSAAYAEIVPENLRDIIPLSRIMDQRWLNKTTTMKSIREALEDKAKRVNVDVALLDGVNPKYMAAVRTMYIKTLDITAAMNHQDELMEADARFQAQEAARQQRMAQAAARLGQIPPAEEKPPVAVLEPVREPVREPAPQPPVSEKLYPLSLKFNLDPAHEVALVEYLLTHAIRHELKVDFHLTKAQAAALKQFLADNNIQYQKIS